MLTHEGPMPRENGRRTDRKPEWAKRARTLFLDTELARMIASSNTRDLGGLVAREAEEHGWALVVADWDGWAETWRVRPERGAMTACCVDGVAWCESHEAADEAAELPTWHEGRPAQVDLSTVDEGRNAATAPNDEV